MKSLVLTSYNHFDYTESPEPELEPGDVLVRVKAVGICGSDVHGYTGQSGRRIPPVIMGHEASGIVERLGPNTNGFSVGERVCFDSTIYCNECDACRQGHYNRCVKRQVLGVSIPGMKRQGAMAEFVRIPSYALVRMPENLSFVQAAMLEPVSIGVHAVNRAGIMSGDTVLIFGAGTIGLFVLQAAHLWGARKIIVSDLSESRLALAEHLGADVVLNPKKDDVVARVREETGGKGVDASFEVVGFAEPLRQAIETTRTGGTVCLVGNLTKNVEIDVQTVISKELSLVGSYASSGEYRDCVELVASGKIDVMPLVSDVRPLAEGQRSFDELHAAKSNLLKIILEP